MIGAWRGREVVDVIDSERLAIIEEQTLLRRVFVLEFTVAMEVKKVEPRGNL
jgi:hypothetical protein